MRRCLFFIAIFIVGCDASTPVVQNSEPRIVPQLSQWTGATGTIRGQVTWVGGPLQVPMIETFRPAPGGRADRVSRPAPNVPIVSSANGGVSGVLVYLKGISASTREWDHPPVSLELNDERPMIRQGDGGPRSIGVTRRGDEITIVNTQDRFHAVRARGAAFWTFTLPDANRPITKRIDQPGIVELSSAAGYYWMHAYLFVSEHPYCAVTNASGQFEIPNIPPGDYELVTWMPSWEVLRRERDPESTSVVRVAFSKHHEWRQPITVRANETTATSLSVPK